MQLKLKRSQREGGIVGKNVIFCLDARVEFTAREKANIQRYKLHKQVIYNSEASKKQLEKSAGSMDGSMAGSLKSLAFSALAGMNLNISIEGLERGTHVECKSMDELLGAESAILTACNNLKEYLETADTFDGREVVIDYSEAKPAIVAEATPAPQKLAAPEAPKKAIAAAAAPAPSIAAPVERERDIDDTEGLLPDPRFSHGTVTIGDNFGTMEPQEIIQAISRGWKNMSGSQQRIFGGVGVVLLIVILSWIF